MSGIGGAEAVGLPMGLPLQLTEGRSHGKTPEVTYSGWSAHLLTFTAIENASRITRIANGSSSAT